MLWAIAHNFTDIASILLTDGISPSYFLSRGFKLAVENSRVDIIKLFFQPPYIHHAYVSKIILDTISEDNAEKIKLLFSIPNIYECLDEADQENFNDMCIFRAITSGRNDIIDLLLSDDRYKLPYRTLMTASKLCDISAFDRLLEDPKSRQLLTCDGCLIGYSYRGGSL